MSELQQVMRIVQENHLPFYVEHNDFMKGGLAVNEEIADLLRDEQIDVIDSGQCILRNSVWSARYYFDDGDQYKIAYASTFDLVIKNILAIMEGHDEIRC